MRVKPCTEKPRLRRAHRHVVTLDGSFVLSDRCLSGLLWWTVARAVVLGKEVRVSGERLQWNRGDAYAYLRSTAPEKWWRDLV